MERKGYIRFKMLSRPQQVLFSTGYAVAVVAILNTAYLLLASHVFGIGENPEVLPVFYQVMLIVHLAVGVLLTVVFGLFVFLHVRKILRIQRRRPWMRLSGSFVIGSLAMLLASGLFILEESNSRENFLIFLSHQALAVGLVAAYFAHRYLSRVKPAPVAWMRRWPFRISAISTIFFLAYIALYVDRVRSEVLDSRIQETSASLHPQEKAIGNGDTDIDYTFSAAGDAQIDSPFFPATTTTTTGTWLPSRIITHDDFPDLEAFRSETLEKGFAPSYFLGAQSCKRCHADIVEQWSTSAHRFSSFNNPFYRRSVELTREKISKKASQFCGGCHDPAVMLSGNMLKDIDPLTPESQAGLTCLACHAIDKVHGVVGNGNYNVHDQTESPYLFDQAKHGLGVQIHDYLLKAKPAIHKRRNLKPVFHKSEFCLTCHKVNLDKTVNDYRWLRGQNEYDAWHNSGVAHNQPQTWYEPPTVRECQDCHMPLVNAVMGDVAADEGKVRSHRFLAVNTALPAIRNDSETLRLTEDFMRDEKLRLEIFAVRRGSDELVMSASDHEISVKPGEIVQIDVVVRNLNVGHMFPGGTNDSNEGWIDFEVVSSDTGGKVFHNGWLGEDRHVDPAAHFYKAVLVDRRGERVAKRNVSDIYATVYANVIAPSTSDIARYRFKVPDDVRGTLTVSAKLMWRKFNREFTEFVFDGQSVPDLPITTIESDTLTLNVAVDDGGTVERLTTADEKRWMRYNDYGIGSVLDKDTRTALAAFKKVVELKPDLMDGYLNLARAYLSEGSLSEAETMLRIASEKAPNQPRLAFFWGSLLEKKGQLEEAVDAYRRTLQHYPKSRDTWIRIGRVYWLLGDYKNSVNAYKSVLDIDPEHALSFHQLQLAYKAMAANAQDKKRVARYRKLSDEYAKGFAKYKTDEDAATVTRKYRELNPFDNLMSQTMIVHEEG